MTDFSVRYIVDDVDGAVDFYTRHLGFEIVTKPGPGFAMMRRDGLQLLVNAPEGGGAGQRLSREVRGGRQALAVAPSGNLVELFQPYRG